MCQKVSENSNYYFFEGIQQTIIYRLMQRNRSFGLYIKISILRPFWREYGPLGLESQNSAKKFAHAGVLLGHQLSQNSVPKVSDPGPSPVPLFHIQTLTVTD